MSIRFLNCSGRYQLPRNLDNVSFPKYATDQELLDFYNEHSDSGKKLQKFPSRSAAEEKCLKLKQAMDWLAMSAQTTKKENKSVMAKKTKQTNAKAAKGKKAAAKSNGKSSLLDHTIHKIAKENPRREGTHGYKTWDALRSGMTYRDAIDAGARNKDIRHDINKGNLELRPPKGGAKATNGTAPKAEKKAATKKAPKKAATKKTAVATSPAADVPVGASVS